MIGKDAVPDTGDDGVADPDQMLSLDLRITDLAGTRALGTAIGNALRAGDVVLLVGDLGAGKTTLTQAIGAALGVTAGITSPTFVIARSHTSGRLPLIHVDAYRLGDALELDDLDLDTDLARAAVVVEWGAGIADTLAAMPLRVELVRHPDDSRTAGLAGDARRWSALLAELSR